MDESIVSVLRTRSFQEITEIAATELPRFGIATDTFSDTVNVASFPVGEKGIAANVNCSV